MAQTDYTTAALGYEPKSSLNFKKWKVENIIN